MDGNGTQENKERITRKKGTVAAIAGFLFGLVKKGPKAVVRWIRRLFGR